MDNNMILTKSLTDDKYYTNTDLRMNKNYNFLLNSKELDSYLDYKESLNHFLKIELPLKSWNFRKIYLYKSVELLSLIKDYLEFFINDITINKSSFVQRFKDEVLLGVVCSELEGTLKIEGVNTTRRQIEKVIKENNPKEKNDRIIINMNKGLEYINNTKVINKNTLRELYEILSKDCLDDEDKIDGLFYRNDSVKIGDHNGCPFEMIDECMESLFTLINNVLKNNDYIEQGKTLLPFIAHYYILYIHPYFDYNGRTSRMVQLWLFILLNDNSLLYLSEAINDNKYDYYKAIDDTRNSHNDLSYFIIYLFNLINNYSLVQKNLEEIKNKIESMGETISIYELQYLKKIIINKNVKWFNWKKFVEFAGLDLTKAGALKILNRFVELKLLDTRYNSKNEKIFIIKESNLKYELKNNN